MKDNVIRVKSFQFAVNAVNMYKEIQLKKHEFILSKQFVRSGTSIGANVREGINAESKADFIHKLGVAQKEYLLVGIIACNEVYSTRRNA
jgi:four helix bundle protein